jgi:hypothetical protein
MALQSKIGPPQALLVLERDGVLASPPQPHGGGRWSAQLGTPVSALILVASDGEVATTMARIRSCASARVLEALSARLAAGSLAGSKLSTDTGRGQWVAAARMAPEWLPRWVYAVREVARALEALQESAVADHYLRLYSIERR